MAVARSSPANSKNNNVLLRTSVLGDGLQSQFENYSLGKPLSVCGCVSRLGQILN